ncbi:MAG: xanthan lyase, partial [Muribaculaceae bacterium]|nr:xanthan lyase [Muribaculaceae bacterium]
MTHAGAFVKRHDGPIGDLSDKNIALWHSHGRYYNQDDDRWQWQRPRLFGTVEDLYTSSYVVPFLIPMLENSGAYVMTPRERDTSPIEIIIDGDGGLAAHDGYHEHSGKHSWEGTSTTGFAYHKPTLLKGDNPFKQGTTRMVHAVAENDEPSTAQWRTRIPKSGTYAVYISYATLPESSSDVTYHVNAADGRHSFTVDQRKGGGTWVYLGSFPFSASGHNRAIVELTNQTSTGKGVITADAVKIGGGMGNVARKGALADYNVSGYPRFSEAARYYLQWAGAPDSVYCESNGENDYTDDFKSRGLWVNWLLGGSTKLPKREGLGIDIDMSMGFHSDAGLTTADSIIGTLGIYCTERRGRFADGRSRLLSRRLTDSIVSSVVRTASVNYRPDWTRRKMRDKSYAEARMPQVPSMLLE